MTIARGLAALAAGAALVADATPASADELRATRGQPLDEISHTVTVRIADGVATYTVQRQLQDRGKTADEAHLTIALPTGGAATGLRIRASGVWHAGELLDSQLAAARYRELTGLGVHDPRDPALLYWSSSSELELQIFPVTPGGVSTVEYTITAPVRYAGGRYWLTYPRAIRAPSAPFAAQPQALVRYAGSPSTSATLAASITASSLPSPATAATAADDATADADITADTADPELRRLVDPIITVQPAWTPPAGGLVIDGKPAQPGAPLALSPFAPPTWRRVDVPSAPAPDAPAAVTYAPSDPEAEYPYAASAIDIPRTRGELRHSLARVHVELQHPSYDNLSLALVTPTGALVPITDGIFGSISASSAFEVRLPEPTHAAGRWQLVVRSGSYEDKDVGALLRWSLAFADRAYSSADPPALIPAGVDGQLRAPIAIAPADPPAGAPAAPWLGRLGRAAASIENAFSRLELDAAPQLSTVPRRAQVVFVLDASYSVGPALLDAQLALIRAYLAHVPDAQLEVIAVRRAARRVFGRFVSATEAPRLLADAVRAGSLSLGNGSALDDGARLAAALLAGRPGPQRVVLATDELVRGTLSEPAVLAALAQLAPTAVVHVVVPSTAAGDQPSLERDDTAALSSLATSHRGIFARLSGLAAPAAALAPVVLELVRPTRIDALAITGKSPLSVPDSLHEGEGLRLLAPTRTDVAPTALSLTGKLWSEPLRLDLTASPALSTATAAFAFGGDQYGHLSEGEQRALALTARAVSPVTSYLAIEPGVRPSKAGLDDQVSTGRFGTIGTGRFGTTSSCGGVRVNSSVDLASLIPTDACVRKHGTGEPWSVKLQLELTRDEIVDIDVLDGTDPLTACLVEAAWSVHLPPSFDHERDSRIITLSNP